MKKNDKVNSPLTEEPRVKKRIFKRKRGGITLDDQEIQEIIEIHSGLIMV